jgi:hypothetical protein
MRAISKTQDTGRVVFVKHLHYYFGYVRNRCSAAQKAGCIIIEYDGSELTGENGATPAVEWTHGQENARFALRLYWAPFPYPGSSLGSFN